MNLYADDTSIVCQHEYVTEIEKVLNKEFANACDWSVDNKLSNHFGEDKTKKILFSRGKNLPQLNITYNNNGIKQYRMIEYPACCLDPSLSGKSMAIKSLESVQSYNSDILI